MHIAICISSLGKGGAERISTIMANYWCSWGNSVSIITLAGKDQSSAYPLDGDVKLYNLELCGESVGLKEKIVDNFNRLKALRGRLKDAKPDIVISFMDTTNVLVLFATRGLNIPVVVTEHCHPDQFPVGKIWGGLRRSAYRWAAAVVVLGEEIRQWFAEKVPAKRLEIIHNPVVLATSGVTESLGPKKKIVLAAGRLAEEKQFDVLIEAFSRIAKRNPEWQLVIFGEGPDRSMLEGLIADKNLHNQVSLPGWIGDLDQQMRRADIFALSSRSEAFPGALCEAMASGLAVISFDCPSGPREIIRDGVDGVLVENGNVKALSDGLHVLMNDAEQRDALGRKALEIVERLSLDKIMGKWDRLLKDVL